MSKSTSANQRQSIQAIDSSSGNIFALKGNNADGSLNVTITASSTITITGNVGINAGSNLIGKVGIDQTTPGTTNAVAIEDGSGNKITSNSTTTTSTQGLDINIRSILNTAPTTAGKLDVKGADGDVFVRQPTGSNLHTVIDSGTLTAITSITNALPAGTNLLGKVGIDQTTLGSTNNVSVSGSSGAGTSNLVKDDTQFGDGVTTGILSSTARLWNGTNYDRMKSIAADGVASTGIQAVGLMAYNGATYDRLHEVFLTSDNQGVQTGLYTLPQNLIYNGSNWDRQRGYNGISAGSSVGVAAVGIAAGIMPAGTSLNTTANHITTNTTTTLTSSTAYISSIVISVPTTGTTSTVTIQDKSGTPKKLVAGLSTAAALTAGNDNYDFTTPMLMTGGIDIVTAGAAAATIDVWVNYYQ